MSRKRSQIEQSSLDGFLVKKRLAKVIEVNGHGYIIEINLKAVVSLCNPCSQPSSEDSEPGEADFNRITLSTTAATSESPCCARSIEDQEARHSTPGVETSTSPFTLSLPYDCSVLLCDNLSEIDKLDIISNFSQYNPTASHTFPKSLQYGKQRSFQAHYLNEYKWLGYSKDLDGCLCLPCCLFGRSTTESHLFVTSSYNNWTKLNNNVKGHAVSQLHKDSVASMEAFRDIHSGKSISIEAVLDKKRQELYALNCERLDAIIECVVLCGR